MRLTNFYRVSGCLNAAGETTSICMRYERLEDLLKYAYAEKGIVNNAVRKASQDLALIANKKAGAAIGASSWSQAVVDRAFAILTGGYSPAYAEKLDTARKASEQLAEEMAVENNEAWAAVVH